MSTTASGTEEKTGDPPAPLWKKIDKITPGTKCILCARGLIDPVTLGELRQFENVTSHYYCLLLSSNLVQGGEDHEGIEGFLPPDILKEVRRGSRLTCSYCKQKGATIGCCVTSCKKKFHLPCGRKMGSMHQFFDQFLSFCSSHRPQQKVHAKFIKLLKEDEDSNTCPICYESVGNTVTNDTLWAPCCQKRWFHRACVQRQAQAQGYFFKCPMCNNNKKFNTEMKHFGIHIPEMDAAWEREPQAFQDLYHTHSVCDAEKCECPDGRSYTQNTGSWRLIRCNSCGSQGTHIVCSALKMTASNNSWRCSFCATIFNKGKGRRMEHYFETRSSRLSSTSLAPSPTPSSSLSLSYPPPSLSPPSLPPPSLSSSLSPPSLSSSLSPPTLSPCPSSPHRSSSPTPSSTSSVSSSISSSQRRTAVDVSIEQDRKRRKPSPETVIQGTNNSEQVKEHNTLHCTSSPSESKSVSDEDEIVVVDDDSESDIEVVDVEKTTSVLRTYPVSSELRTNEGKTIKVHKVAAEGHTTPLEIGSLGAVNMRPASMNHEPKSWKTKRPDNASSTSQDPNHLHIQNVGTDPNSHMNGSTLGIKIADVRHSNELFSATRKEDETVKAPQTTAQTVPNRSLLEFVSRLTDQHIYYLPARTMDGQATVQAYIPVTALSLSLQQQLAQAQQQQQQQLIMKNAASGGKSLSSPDVVTLD
ncbi:putative GPI-anchored protein pfl2 isoform X2 [Thrips palmi]|uniref:GPI-anchored protein pfl2 isoform X2 n=1 Tax=Thrips palmi TaxID=161013 RepID=A0A6P8ZDE7_THRPL|nr:putative GPI-anchored protein pfl2 isoform X2 [Thrips palmi]